MQTQHHMAISLLGLCLAAPLPGQLTRDARLLTVPPEQGTQISMHVVRHLGDVNGDGFDDLVSLVAQQFGGATLVRVHNGRDGRALLSLSFTPPQVLPESLETGDYDNDGVKELALGFPAHGTSFLANAGRIAILRSKDGFVIQNHVGASAGARLGERFALTGDLDSDGLSEVLARCRKGTGFEYELRGSNGKTLRRFDGTGLSDPLGDDLWALGDLDGDGTNDYGVSRLVGSNNVGNLHLWSGKSGSYLRRLKGSYSIGNFGAHVVALEDLNKDGCDDLAVAEPWGSPNGARSGRVWVFSGKTGSMLQRYDGSAGNVQAGALMRRFADVDNDGVSDLLWLEAGRARVVSSKTRTPLRVYRAPVLLSNQRDSLEYAGDVDADGDPDALFGITATTSKPGEIIAVSYEQPGFWQNRQDAPIGAWRDVEMHIDAGKSQALRPFLIIGSMTGRAPGVQLPVGTLALYPDSYFDLLLRAQQAVIRPMIGWLDGEGRGVARFGVRQPLPMSMVGVRLEHAAVVFDMQAQIFTWVSNTAGLHISRH